MLQILCKQTLSDVAVTSLYCEFWRELGNMFPLVRYASTLTFGNTNKRQRIRHIERKHRMQRNDSYIT